MKTRFGENWIIIVPTKKDGIEVLIRDYKSGTEILVKDKNSDIPHNFKLVYKQKK